MMLVESGLLAFLAAAGGAVFAWWSAPFVVSMINPPDNPARLILPADWRVLGLACRLTLVVVLLFGFLPALRASSVRPCELLKGGDDPHARQRLMNGMIAMQVAFCFLVLLLPDFLSLRFIDFLASRQDSPRTESSCSTRRPGPRSHRSTGIRWRTLTATCPASSACRRLDFLC